MWCSHVEGPAGAKEERRETRTKELKKTHFLVFNKALPAHNDGPAMADFPGQGARKFGPELLVPHHKTLA